MSFKSVLADRETLPLTARELQPLFTERTLQTIRQAFYKIGEPGVRQDSSQLFVGRLRSREEQVGAQDEAS